MNDSELVVFNNSNKEFTTDPLTGCLYDCVSVCSYTIHNYVFCQCYLINKEEFYYI